MPEITIEDLSQMDEEAAASGAAPDAPNGAGEPAHDLEAEAAVLAAVLIDPAAISRVPDLRPAHFYAERHRRIYEACCALRDRADPIDPVTAGAWLREHDRLAQVGGMAYLTELLAAPLVVEAGGPAERIAHHARIVIDASLARDRLHAIERAAALLRYGAADGSAIVSDLRASIDATAREQRGDVIALLDGAAIAAPLDEIPYLCRELGLVGGAGAPHLVAGYGFSGKTLALQSLALSLAADARVWGAYSCARPHRVLHVDLEQGDRLTRRRYQRLALAAGIDLASLGDALSVAVMPELQLRADHMDRWERLIAGRDVLVLDSLRAATVGQEENSSEIRSGLDMLGALSERTGCRAIVIHHARKPTDDAPAGAYSIRGSSAIFDGCDGAYVFSAARGEPVAVEHVKSRSEGELIEGLALVIADVPRGESADGSPVDPRAGLSVTVRGAELIAERRDERAAAARAAAARRDAERVVEHVREHPGQTTRELRALLRLSGDRFAAAVALAAGRIDVRAEVTSAGRATRHYPAGA